MRRLLFCLVLPATLLAQKMVWGTLADFNSRYVWRGIAYSKGPVFQPSFWIGRGGTTFSVWSNMPLSHEPRRGQFDQVFFTGTRETKASRWKVEPTVQGYYWQGFGGESNAKTLELSLRASTPVFGRIHFFSSHTVDIASFAGSYIADAGLEGKKRLGGLDWEGNATLAWANAPFNRTYVGVNRSALNYAELGIAVTKANKQRWYIRPHAEFIVSVAGPIRRAVDHRNLLNVGIAIGRDN